MAARGGEAGHINHGFSAMVLYSMAHSHCLYSCSYFELLLDEIHHLQDCAIEIKRQAVRKFHNVSELCERHYIHASFLQGNNEFTKLWVSATPRAPGKRVCFPSLEFALAPAESSIFCNTTIAIVVGNACDRIRQSVCI